MRKEQQAFVPDSKPARQSRHVTVNTKTQPADIMENLATNTDNKLLSPDERLQSQATESSKSLVDSPVVPIEV